jgi:ATP-dependent exoDNAse (exonuclease V) beta subunit
MTIHKAKGLEFDNVILPFLERKLPYDEQQLLMWLERPTDVGSDLILAPIKAYESDQDPIFNYLRIQERQKNDYEIMRLLYVAATRAKKNLILLANATTNGKNEFTKPAANSFLKLLWPHIKPVFVDALQRDTINKTEQLVVKDHLEIPVNRLKRLSPSWQMPVKNQQDEIVHKKIIEAQSDEIHLSAFVEHNSQIFGTVFHKILQNLTIAEINAWSSEKFERQKILWRKLLIQMGMLEKYLDDSIIHMEST